LAATAMAGMKACRLAGAMFSGVWLTRMGDD